MYLCVRYTFNNVACSCIPYIAILTRVNFWCRGTFVIRPFSGQEDKTVSDTLQSVVRIKLATYSRYAYSTLL